MTPETLTFHDVCETFDITPRTLRHYENLELVASRREGVKRFYDQKAQARLTLVLRGRRFGFSLEHLRQWLEIYDTQGANAQMTAWVDMADDQLTVLRAQKCDIEAAITQMSQLRDDAAWQLANMDNRRRA